jgi:dihydrofolate reductase
MTAGKVVICGRKTLESFPNAKPLKNRSTLCLCSAKHNREDCFCINNFEEALRLAKELSKIDEVWIIGGQSIYELFLDVYDRVYVTKVDAEGAGDAFFPNLDSNDSFRCISQLEPVEDNGYNISFCIYERRKGVNNA